VIKEQFTFPSAAGDCGIEGVRFLPEDGKVRGTLQLIHGMMEHIGRYDGMAQFFVDRGWAVYGHSHLGHGHSTNGKYTLGYFGRNNAEGHIFRADAKAMHARIKRDFPDVPAVLFGYSMGSFICRLCLTEFGDELAAAVVCSTGNGNDKLSLGIFSTKMLSLPFGRRKATMIDRVAQQGFNKRTGGSSHLDWLSDDLSYLVESGKADPLCGFTFSNRGYYDLMTLMRAMLRDEAFENTPLDLPILLISGAEDPIGDYGEGVKETLSRYRETGHHRAEMKLYPGRWHEIHLDRGRRDVWQDLSNWLDRAVFSV
jgi:alpha-beta hydrolase superfamily lysophospholipase